MKYLRLNFFPRLRRRSVGKPIIIWLLLLALILPTASCGNRRNRAAERLAEDSEAAQDLDANSTFSNLTLEQPDEKGQTLWKVKAAQVVYSPDRAVAQVKNPYGQLYQDGKPIYRIQASEGEIRQNGERIFLRGKVVATDAKSGAVVQGDELEWQPKQDLLIVRRNIRGDHPQLKMQADQARIFNRQRRMELSGKVLAISNDPQLQMQAERLVWLMDQKKITSDRPLQVQEFEGKQVTRQASGDRGEVNLATKVVRLNQNGRVDLLEPPVQVASNSLIWTVSTETLVADQPVTVVHRQQQVNLTADQGRMDMKNDMAYLTGNVRAIAQRNQSEMTSDTLTWNMKTEQVEAEGNVVYNQAANPPLTLRGPRAVGKLENQTIVVSGGRVVTDIIPEGLN
jgi:LPS export ABC transporter protein LptC